MTNSNKLKPRPVLFITSEFKNSSYCEIMANYIITKVEMNDSSIGQPQPVINLATYLINFQEFKKSNTEVRENGNKVWLFYFEWNICKFF